MEEGAVRKPSGRGQRDKSRKLSGRGQHERGRKVLGPGRVVCWGCNEFGQNSKQAKDDVAFKDGLLSHFSSDLGGQVKVAACGASHTLVVTDSNEIYAWGNGNSGQLGTWDMESSCEPRRIELVGMPPDTVVSDRLQVIQNKLTQRAGRPEVVGVACGGRHSMVVFSNGQVYSFGNNFYAQLGYNFREKNYKENQIKPYLLKSLIGRPVSEVACGDKHSIFRFQSGSIACVGCNSTGQIGTGDREEALVPKILEMTGPITHVACGSNHSLAISDKGEVYIWGYGKACGNKSSDVLSPVLMETGRSKVTKVAGGMYHSMALTASGNIYTWGAGSDGQLGHGDQVLFLSEPQRLKNHHLRGKIIHISSGESFSAAVTENGRLYMWGKNSHTIHPDEASGHRVWEPHCVNSRGQPVQYITCGSWHAVSITGSPEFIRRGSVDKLEFSDSVCLDHSEGSVEDSADIDHCDSVITPEDLGNTNQDLFTETTDEVGVFLPSLSLRRDMTAVDRDKTKLSLAEFYAPTPDIPREPMHEDEDTEQVADIGNIPVSARSTKLVVQVPMNSEKKEPQMAAQHRCDVATSPIPFSSSESESAAQEYVSPAPTKVDSERTIPQDLSESQEAREDREFRAKIPKTYNREDMTKMHALLNYERQKTCGIKHPPSVVQISRTSADSFMLPRENTGFTSKQIDFAEMEHLRSRGNNKSPEKILKIQGKSTTDGGVVRLFESPYTSRSYTEDGPSRIQAIDHRNSPYSRGGDNFLHKFPDGRFMDSPALRSGRHSETTIINLSQFERAASNYAVLVSRASESSLADYARSWAAPETSDDSRLSQAKSYVKHPQPIKNSIPNKNNKANFRNYKISSFIRRRKLQISRSNTVVAEMESPAKPSSDKVKDMQRYAKVHNPQGTSFKQESRIRLGQSFQRKVSIPASRAYLAKEEPVDGLCVKGQTGSSRKNPTYSSASFWRDKTDMDKVRAMNGHNSSYLASDHSSPSRGTPESHREVEEGATPGVEEQGDATPRDSKLVDVLKENSNKMQHKPADKFRRGKLVGSRSQSFDDNSTVMLKIEPRGVSISTKDSGMSQVR
ncbi:uncharacterized protein LOC110462625 isoform X2 [Mizuhopecten yessoensis]|uniref:Ultraviolet-B receptor UVR8 n=1 Tax=Mizuhopecten yessoensis TaxID=6573 RepID=A0A210PXW1_MIZYE|nr:uncharacterized protein LOC110462625 isoform X2 [Mizuhopecten yessoensis]OWF41330.1 Ultraviolet-B receptor UVR8 [Mizuhopecten yessoensis]